MTEGASPAEGTVASRNWKPLALIAICAFAVVYGIAGSFVPEVPYLSDEVLIYPLLLLYKDTPFFHIVTVIFAVCVGIWIIFRLKMFPSPDRTWIAGVLILSVGMITLTAGKIFAPDYRHHDSIEVTGHLYQLGSSRGPDWPTLQYLVYRCDQNGLMCELVDVPTSGIDRSQLPSGSLGDRSASFVVSDIGDLLIAVDNITYPVSPNSPS
ncbi:MAG: hypothetical protein IAE80_14130 [Anaerolinea sp.]|nr:hypothetical protein [Anaerolinea sp.]